jgi:hypothetical protein
MKAASNVLSDAPPMPRRSARNDAGSLKIAHATIATKHYWRRLGFADTSAATSKIRCE